MVKRFGLIGFPVKHSYSAIMHNAAFKELGIDACYELFEIEPQRLKEGFRKLLKQGVCGFNVTSPHKEKSVGLVDELDEETRLIGAVNTIKVHEDKKTKGFNTDGLGFVTHLMQAVGFNPQGKKISILGAAGAAKAVAVQLAKNKAKKIILFDIDEKKLKALVEKLAKNFTGCEVGSVCEANDLLDADPDLLINTTPIGMHGDDPLVFAADKLTPKLLVYDLIYNPAQTALLREAKRKGCAGVFNGLGMLLYQGVLSFKVWMEIEPPIEVMEQALRNILAS